MEQGQELVFMVYNNFTRSFNFRDKDISYRYTGFYSIVMTLGDDNWKGPLTANYTLPIEVRVPQNATIEELVEDESFKGA